MCTDGLIQEPTTPTEVVRFSQKAQTALRREDVRWVHRYMLSDAELIESDTYDPESRHALELEKALLEFFGTYENAMKLAEFYVLEIDQVYQPDAYATEFGYRIRLKTSEELFLA